MIREIKRGHFDSRGYTDENSLAAMGLTNPDWLSRKMTYLSGRESASKFSFLAFTEGRGLTSYIEKKKEINDVEYKYPVIGKMRYTVEIVSYPDAATNDRPCFGNTTAEIICKDRWGIRDYGLISPNRNIQVQIMSDPKPFGAYFKYVVQIKSGNPNSFIPLTELAAGKHWLLSAPKVPQSGSVGNEHRVMSSGLMTNQISFSRYTQEIQGNVANTVVSYEFSGEDTTDGRPTTLWISEQQRQFDDWIRTFLNHDLYTSEYNRVNGVIPLKYELNNKPIPIGSGVREMVREGGSYITFGDSLPYSLIDQSILSALHSDKGGVQLVVHGGRGFGRILHKALMDEAKLQMFHYTLGENMLKPVGSTGLELGTRYFNTYKTQEDNRITFVWDSMFDKDGMLGQQDWRNGNIIGGLPRSSYTGVVLDYSTDDTSGEPNVEYVGMKGQSWITGIYEGMTPIPDFWTIGNPNRGNVKQLGTDKDMATYEIKTSSGISIRNLRRCMLFESIL